MMTNISDLLILLKLKQSNTRIKLAILLLLVLSIPTMGQRNPGSFLKSNPPNYKVKSALEVESLFPMFFYGGYHLGVGYRFAEKFRIRLSVINSGTYDAEPAGVSNNKDNFKRYYKTSPSVFFGYNVWRNLELYAYLEYHTFSIEQKSTGTKQDLKSIDVGPGIGYQFFIGRSIYIQPAFHVYFRGNNSLNFQSQTYNIPNVDLSPVMRVGYRFWKQFPV